MDLGRSMSTAMTRSIASGAEAPVMGAVACMVLTRFTVMVPAATSASGAVRRQTVRAVPILLRAATRSSPQSVLRHEGRWD